MLYGKLGDSASDADAVADDAFIFSGVTRLDTTGDTHIDVELNQSDWVAPGQCPEPLLGPQPQPGM